MDKISSILPASPRITAVDLKSSGTARSGMPSYGRPQLELTGSARRETLPNSVAGQANGAQGPINDPHVEIVDRIAREFFMQKSEPSKTELTYDRNAIFGADADLDPITKTEVAPMEPMYNSEVEMETQVDVVAQPTNMEVEPLEEDMDLPATGAYIDVEV